jgi:hypothetical protein
MLAGVAVGEVADGGGVVEPAEGGGELVWIDTTVAVVGWV